ncbi:uncharacterized protein isoform X1 [Takifugu rubripes]|uniref:uncharacterized protein isoform X1 n=1 Tax=Takifugu rubripes TaxID=31033 RepID=UPI00114536B5|nr:uncharacterized protein LOC115250611 isoform X1 [Takifugu rubripes]
MTSFQRLCCLMCVFLGNIVHGDNTKLSIPIRQDANFLSADVGDNVTLKCFYEDSFTTTLYWYKQVIGQKPKLMSSFYLFGQKASFTDEFRNSTRFQLVTENLQHHLTISDLRVADSATYYCLASNFFEYQFHNGTTVSVRGSGFNVPTSVHQSASQSIQAGGSVMLNCTVHTGWTCDGDHTVYWFRNSGPSQLGLMYSHTGGNKQCERKTNTCFYNFSMKNLKTSQTGTYYCAVAACGHILFGNGTKLVFEDEGNHLVLVYFLSAAWIFTIIVVVLLSISVFMTKRKNSHHSLDSQSRVQASSTANAEGNQKEDNLHYAALRANQSNRSRKQKNRQNECVYSTVRS